ncbi:acyl-CoA dehydrogenase [Zhengella mangrovi]|uniref:Acyl-CoA dehydrogenase n=1 Tax=Zhengella mangrovi TaxID=1982044 RepID=A0A2G1QQU2_9HYPH|nr:acyl-CoA dehydrogenase family protein [Zhengella mangrovi]PHP67896.1 acyl-CoA dehydrogenase [Zhengella mangrovi]
MKAFQAPVEDILFSLEHVAGTSRLPDWDGDLAAEVIRHFAAFAEGEIAPLDEPGDRQGARLVDGRVVMPDGFRAVYRAYAEQGWTGLNAPEEFGGQGLPAPVLAATSEIFSAANQSLQMVTGLVPGAITTIRHFGSGEQKARLLPPLVSGEWLSTMCLTEPASGSDLSTVRTRAVEADGAWRITGEKIFISGGDQDMSDGILHLVLARTGSMEEGTRGLSLFVCLDRRADGSRNAVSVARIEEKMGLHASPTCQMVFDGAEAEIIGRPGEGLKAMFTMMNHARIDVSLQGVAHSARAADISRSYAQDRRQGRAATTGEPVTIDRHPDIAAKLDEQDMLALGLRALCHVALVTLEEGNRPDLVDFLTPVCKYACTEAGIRAANLGIQVLGGYGYLQEYRVEQTFRDARISAIYEGANGIHALTLATRMLRNRNGAAAAAFEGFIAAEAIDGPLASGVGSALDSWRAARDIVVQSANPAEQAEAFMELTAQVAFLAMWNRIAAAAGRHPDPARLERLAARVRRMGPARIRYWFDLHQVAA